jgi:uncharacterized protein YndB with AHSA1/START domain
MPAEKRNPPEDTAHRTITSSRRFPFGREQVFRTFSDPAQLALWWGPKGFTNTIHTFDLRPGGDWRYVMHGPNGADYRNESRFLEIIEPERIVLEHVRPFHHFLMTMVFDAQAGQTQLTWDMCFDSAAEVTALRVFIAKANEENFDRLGAHLAGLAGKEKS